MGIADQRLAVGFLGAGYIADWHAKALRSARNARIIAVCDRDEVRARAFAARNGINQVYTSLSSMLSESRLDVIHVLLPPELHAQMAGEIIDAGIDVLLEKPMATCDEACSKLIERARSKGVTLGVSHNFLFAPVYEQLKSDLKSGKLGRPDEITITWNKGVDQLQSGPFNLWMLREPQNIILEVGPHSVGHMLDLVGPVGIACARASNPLEFPGGMLFYRRWHIEAGQTQTSVTLNFSFASGFAEHSIHIRGSLASATVDFERNTYVLHQHTKFGLDFDTLPHNSLSCQCSPISGSTHIPTSCPLETGTFSRQSLRPEYRQCNPIILRESREFDRWKAFAGTRPRNRPNLHRNRSESRSSTDPVDATD